MCTHACITNKCAIVLTEAHFSGIIVPSSVDVNPTEQTGRGLAVGVQLLRRMRGDAICETKTNAATVCFMTSNLRGLNVRTHVSIFGYFHKLPFYFFKG